MQKVWRYTGKWNSLLDKATKEERDDPVQFAYKQMLLAYENVHIYYGEKT